MIDRPGDGTRGYTRGMAAPRPWPELRKEDRPLIDLMEDILKKTQESPEDLHAAAEALRAEATKTDIGGIRDANLALADRYDLAATGRTARPDQPSHS